MSLLALGSMVSTVNKEWKCLTPKKISENIELSDLDILLSKLWVFIADVTYVYCVFKMKSGQYIYVVGQFLAVIMGIQTCSFEEGSMLCIEWGHVAAGVHRYWWCNTLCIKGEPLLISNIESCLQRVCLVYTKHWGFTSCHPDDLTVWCIS